MGYSTQTSTSYAQRVKGYVDKKLVKITFNMQEALNSGVLYKLNCPQVLLIKC